MDTLRSGLTPSAVYFNPTDLCNLNCAYCYIPESMRNSGVSMTPQQLVEALRILKEYFARTLAEGVQAADRIPWRRTHGCPRSRVCRHRSLRRRFRSLGCKPTAPCSTMSAIEFLTSRGIGIGLSLDAHVDRIATRTRSRWDRSSVFDSVVEVMREAARLPELQRDRHSDPREHAIPHQPGGFLPPSTASPSAC